MIGLLIGWSWRPRWTGFIFLGFRFKLRFFWTAPPGFGARRIWLAFTALSVFFVCRTLWSRLGSSSKKSDAGASAPTSATVEEVEEEEEAFSRASDTITEKEQDFVTEKDLEHLLHLLEAGNANLEWQSMMDKSTTNMSYQAWRHKPERQLGKWDFLSKSRGTIYEGLMFPMLVKEELELWPEQHLRQRMWMKIDEAREACRDWGMKEALDVLVQRLSSPSRKPMEEDNTIPLTSIC